MVLFIVMKIDMDDVLEREALCTIRDFKTLILVASHSNKVQRIDQSCVMVCVMAIT